MKCLKIRNVNTRDRSIQNSYILNKSFEYSYALYDQLILFGPRGNRVRVRRPQFVSRRELRFYLFVTASKPDLGLTQPPIQWVLKGKEAGA
jgi:hypothetical protein